MLTYTTVRGRTIHLNPRHVTAIMESTSPWGGQEYVSGEGHWVTHEHWCIVHTTDGDTWEIAAHGQSVSLAVWKAIR